MPGMSEESRTEESLRGKVYRKVEAVVAREIAGETILVPIRGELANMERIFTLNPVAGYIWEQIDGQRSLAEIRDGILESFAVDRDEAEADIRAFVGELLREKLVTEAG